MLSYRHSFHAGNFADVIKHVVIVEILSYLCKKDKVFDYIDTHAGAGLFSLESDHAKKLHEYTNGIGKLSAEDWPELARYFEIINSCNDDCSSDDSSSDDSNSDDPTTLAFYPGSPLFARDFLRVQDKAWLYELHPEDYKLLDNNIGDNRQVHVKNEDGFKGLLSLVPPLSRRALVLIDPSYEVKSDYQQVVNTVVLAHKKFPSGTYAIWYPVVDRSRIIALENNFKSSGIKNIQRFELSLEPDSHVNGMTAAGMIVINPPWTLMQKMSQVLPKLMTLLTDDEVGSFACDVLVDE